MGQCLSSSSSNGGVAPEPPPPVPMAFIVRITNKKMREKIDSDLLKLWCIFGKGCKRFDTLSADGLEIHITGSFVPGTVEKCLQKYEKYVEVEHLGHAEEAP